MSALSKAEILESLCTELKLDRTDAKLLIELFFETLRDALENGENVKLSGLGKFVLRDKSERPGRNPKTGEEIPVRARRVVTFKPGLKLKRKIEDHAPESDV